MALKIHNLAFLLHMQPLGNVSWCQKWQQIQISFKFEWQKLKWSFKKLNSTLMNICKFSLYFCIYHSNTPQCCLLQFFLHGRKKGREMAQHLSKFIGSIRVLNVVILKNRHIQYVFKVQNWILTQAPWQCNFSIKFKINFEKLGCFYLSRDLMDALSLKEL